MKQRFQLGGRRRYSPTKGYGNLPLQEHGLVGKAVPWHGEAAVIVSVFMQGNHPSFTLRLPSGKTFTATTEEVLKQMGKEVKKK